MRVYYLPLVLAVVACLLADWYLYRQTVKRLTLRLWSRVQLWGSVVMYLLLVVALCLPRRDGSEEALLTVMWLLFGFMSVYVPKLLFVVFDLVSAIPLLLRRKRWSWLSYVGGGLSVLLFVGMWWGALVNRYRMQVREVEVEIAGLPEVFDGYRLVQFSDLHVGTYGTDTTYVSKVVDKINSLDGDLVVFTGDIVNRRTSELPPFVRPLSRLRAKDGVYSILGNHDYGDYSEWPSDEYKARNMVMMDSLQAAMGWRLLRNEHCMLRAGNDSIALIGVENVGDPPFTVYGSLPDSYPSLNDDVTKLLLTHNPAHWCTDIADNDSVNVALALSGHTHAMQIEMFGLSPAAWRYDTWGGLYEDSKSTHKLYVNIGMGTVALPMRFGATPEITVITLRRGK